MTTCSSDLHVERTFFKIKETLNFLNIPWALSRVCDSARMISTGRYRRSHFTLGSCGTFPCQLIYLWCSFILLSSLTATKTQRPRCGNDGLIFPHLPSSSFCIQAAHVEQSTCWNLKLKLGLQEPETNFLIMCRTASGTASAALMSRKRYWVTLRGKVWAGVSPLNKTNSFHLSRHLQNMPAEKFTVTLRPGDDDSTVQQKPCHLRHDHMHCRLSHLL